MKYFLAKEVESQELAALENLLAKAQKAREVQAKVLYFKFYFSRLMSFVSLWEK